MSLAARVSPTPHQVIRARHAAVQALHAEWTKFRTGSGLAGWLILSLGVAAAVRDSAAAIGLVLGLLYLFPVAASLISDATIARHLQQIGPMSAGLDVQATTGVNSLPLTPWQGLGVVALWTAGALLLGASVLEFRDG